MITDETFRNLKAQKIFYTEWNKKHNRSAHHVLILKTRQKRTNAITIEISYLATLIMGCVRAAQLAQQRACATNSFSPNPNLASGAFSTLLQSPSDRSRTAVNVTTFVR